MGDRFSQKVTDFRDRRLPEPAMLAGYAALIDRFDLRVLSPSKLTAIAERHHPVSTNDWKLLTPRHAPLSALGNQLEFALKWEGVDLAVLKAIFSAVAADELAALIRTKPTGAYARRLWFLFEWLTHRTLDVPDAAKVRAVLAVSPEQQFGMSNGVLSTRHRVIDNLPGTPAFCPLVRRTPILVEHAARGLDRLAREVVGRTHPDVVARAAAFLLLRDSRSSFRIEGEQPSAPRAARWGQAIGEAGVRRLNLAELERLQRIVIGDARFVRLGLRVEGGFVGAHDRQSQQPIPDHISARPEDLRSLIDGIIAYAERATAGGVDPVVAAAAIAFGFVYVHPFDDGNGRIHRWLIHHVLAAAGYNPEGVVFPISAAILREIGRYRAVLESYSRPLLALIDWHPTVVGNVEVTNDTGVYYRFFDATAHAEFLYHCVAETVEKDLPSEVHYLQAYDEFVRRVHDVIDMPNSTVALLHHFLRNGQGRFSKRAREKEFAALTDDEATTLEEAYTSCFAGLTGTAR